jgi:hypothetical protein
MMGYRTEKSRNPVCTCLSLSMVTLRNSYNTAYAETPFTPKYRWVFVELHQHELIHNKLFVMKSVQTEFPEKCPDLTV